MHSSTIFSSGIARKLISYLQCGVIMLKTTRRHWKYWERAGYVRGGKGALSAVETRKPPVLFNLK
jgi:hypothetical protein